MKYLNHLINLIKLNLKLIRNSTVTERLNLGYENLTYDLLDFINEDEPNYYKRLGIGPINNQKLRTKLIKDILIFFKPNLIVETGTFLGDSTEFFGKHSKVLSIEKSKLYFYLSKSRFFSQDNIEILNGDSAVELKKINCFENKIFFYLDAHWGTNLPLENEIQHITNNFLNYIICIDDFKVPDNDSWGFDSYDGLSLDINLLNIKKEYKIYFPGYNSEAETGEKRGAVFITNSEDYDQLFQKHNFFLYTS